MACHLIGAESILSLMGYHQKPSPLGHSSKSPVCYVLEGVLDPDLISRLALDCMIAYCECQVSKNFKNQNLLNLHILYVFIFKVKVFDK